MWGTREVFVLISDNVVRVLFVEESGVCFCKMGRMDLMVA